MALALIFAEVIKVALPHFMAYVLRKAEEFERTGQDPQTYDWESLYGRTTEELRAEVDARLR